MLLLWRTGKALGSSHVTWGSLAMFSCGCSVQSHFARMSPINDISLLPTQTGEEREGRRGFILILNGSFCEWVAFSV